MDERRAGSSYNYFFLGAATVDICLQREVAYKGTGRECASESTYPANSAALL